VQREKYMIQSHLSYESLELQKRKSPKIVTTGCSCPKSWGSHH
jgi:hypothetical protein